VSALRDTYSTVLRIPDLSSMLLLSEARPEMQIMLLKDAGAFNEKNRRRRRAKLDILKLI